MGRPKKKAHHKRKKAGSKTGKRPKGPVSTDRHWLYQDSVQSPREHVILFDQFYEAAHAKPASSLKEDFCGTALLSAEWVRTRPDNTAVGVDLDKSTLDWGEENNLATLDPGERKRLTIFHDDVCNIFEPKVDIVAALNFSYFEFKTRDALRNYFECARRSLKPDGQLILDMFGGWEAQMEEVDKTRNEGYTYVWEQTEYDPVTHRTQFQIHFNFQGGGGLKGAFEYNWRLWTIPEVGEILEEAGFGKVDVYWEGIDDDTDEGSGEFELVTEAENQPGWIAMLVASA